MRKVKVIKKKTEKEYQVKNCDFEFLCPKQWNEFDLTGNEKVRFCQHCKENVYLCETRSEFVKHARLNHCVAASDSLPETLKVMKQARLYV